MDRQDNLYKSKYGLFSYRVSGILIQDGKVLLQHVIDDPTYAFPGGHVNFGVYPTICKEKLKNLSDQVETFVFI